jgi:hypothetical protein
MSYQEKKTIISIVTGAVLLAAYCVYTFGRYQAGMMDLGDLKSFAVTMLIFIGIGIVAMIVIQIIFHILLSISIAVRERKCDDKEIEKAVEATIVEDEMDRLIELKSGRVSFIVVGAGFLASLVTLAAGSPPAVMLNILYLAFGLGTVAGGVASIYYYRAGIR